MGLFDRLISLTTSLPPSVPASPLSPTPTHPSTKKPSTINPPGNPPGTNSVGTNPDTTKTSIIKPAIPARPLKTMSERESPAPKGLGTRARPEAFGTSSPAHGPLRSLILDLAPFDSLEVDLSADIFWTPSHESRARLQIPESFLKLLRIEVSGRKLSISSLIALSGSRISITLNSPRLMEIHAAGNAFIEAEDILCGRLIATARGNATLLLAGETAESHMETSDSAVIDAASLRSMIAVADLSGMSTILARVQDALEADLHDESALLTVGCPRIIDARRHALPTKLNIGRPHS